MAEHAHTTTAPKSSRRGFLRGLTTLPLIGGVTLIGSPAKADVPTTDELLDSYDEWLFYERRLLHIERVGMETANHTVHLVPSIPAA